MSTKIKVTADTYESLDEGTVERMRIEGLGHDIQGVHPRGSNYVTAKFDNHVRVVRDEGFFDWILRMLGGA